MTLVLIGKGLVLERTNKFQVYIMRKPTNYYYTSYWMAIFGVKFVFLLGRGRQFCVTSFALNSAAGRKMSSMEPQHLCDLVTF